jgi:hypothetical protein
MANPLKCPSSWLLRALGKRVRVYQSDGLPDSKGSGWPGLPDRQEGSKDCGPIGYGTKDQETTDAPPLLRPSAPSVVLIIPRKEGARRAVKRR